MLQLPDGMNRKLAIVLGVAFLAAAGSTLFFYVLLSQYFDTSETPAVRHSIVVASRSLPRGTKLAKDDLVEAPWAGAMLPSGAITDVGGVVGRFLDAPIGEGEPVTAARLAEGARGGAARIPDGMRAVSVHVSEFAGVTEMFQPGDRVDVHVIDGPPSAGNMQLRIRTFLQNVEVLATGKQAAGGSPSRQPVATLLVDSGDAEALNLADHAGYIRLTLRNPLDQGVEPSAGGKLEQVLKARLSSPLPKSMPHSAGNKEVAAGGGKIAGPVAGSGANAAAGSP